MKNTPTKYRGKKREQLLEEALYLIKEKDKSIREVSRILEPSHEWFRQNLPPVDKLLDKNSHNNI